MVLSNQVYLKPSQLQPSRGEEARRAQEGQPLPAVSGEICHTREDMLYGWVEAGKNSFFVPQVLWTACSNLVKMTDTPAIVR